MRRGRALTASLFALLLAVPAGANAATFTNPATITIPSFAQGSPYPSEITASGVVGQVAQVKVTTNDLNSTFPERLRLLLVGPTGASLLLQDCVGDGFDEVNVDTTFDDAAAASLPDAAAWASGSYKPTSYCAVAGDFPAPGPGTAYGVPAPIGSATLTSTYAGTSPNGVWRLFTADGAPRLGGGTIAGWSLEIVDRGRCGREQATITGTTAPETINGTEGDDVIQARKGRDRINGRGGDDLLCGARGKDKIFGNKGDDTLIGGDQADLLNGGSGNNRIFGGTPEAPDKNSKNICAVGDDDKSSHCKEK
jgi:Ca2+-binding RTX toxin-like protein